MIFYIRIYVQEDRCPKWIDIYPHQSNCRCECECQSHLLLWPQKKNKTLVSFKLISSEWGILRVIRRYFCCASSRDLPGCSACGKSSSWHPYVVYRALLYWNVFNWSSPLFSTALCVWLSDAIEVPYQLKTNHISCSKYINHPQKCCPPIDFWKAILLHC